MFKNILSFDGRIRRTEYALSLIIYYVIYFFVAVLQDKPNYAWIGIILFFPIYVLIAQGTKRCHDLRRTGWWQIIPFYGFVMLFSTGDY